MQLKKKYLATIITSLALSSCIENPPIDLYSQLPITCGEYVQKLQIDNEMKVQYDDGKTEFKRIIYYCNYPLQQIKEK